MTRLKKLAQVLMCSALCIGSADVISGANNFNFISQAEARQKTLFEALFPRAAARRRARELARQKLPEIEVKKISAPKYFTYKPEPLKFINFAPLTAKLTPTDADVEKMHTGTIASKTDAKVTSDVVAVELVADSVSSGSKLAEMAIENKDPKEVSEFFGNTRLSRSKPETAPTEAISEPAAATMPMADMAQLKFTDHLDTLSAVKVEANSGIRKALLDHYTNSPEFLWLNADFTPNEKANAIVAVLRDSDQMGLDPLNYMVSTPGTTDGDSAIEAAIAFEMTLTARAMRYAADATHGTVDPNKLSGYHDFPANKADFTEIIQSLSKAPSPSEQLLDAHPKMNAFTQLKDELAQLRGQNDPEDRIEIKLGTLLKPGNSSDQLPSIIAAIKKRGSKNLLTLHEGTLANSDGDVYTPELVKLVKAFQRENKLGADGIVGRATIAKLVGISSQDKIDQVLFAMERLRWHPTEFGTRHVFINQPAYRATYMVDGKPGLSMRAIVGKSSNQTSFFHDIIETVVYNPYWGVPRSILVNEMLPKLRENPAYLDERGYELTNAKGQQVASSSVDWTQVGSRPKYDVRQTPGPRNALGELKILFPNKHAIYMHDTPSRGLFKRSARALSHGCVRLQDPKGMAAAVLGTSVSRIKKMLSKGHSKQALPSQIPVYVAYFTAWPKQDGQVQYFRDIYKRDRALSKAIVATANIRQSGV